MFAELVWMTRGDICIDYLSRECDERAVDRDALKP